MYCRHCGAQLSENANFCHKCGKTINSQPEEQQPEVQQPEVQQPEVTAEQPKVSISKSIKSLIFGAIGLEFAAVCSILLIEFFAMFAIYVGTEDSGAIIAFALIMVPSSIIGLCFSNAAKSNSDEFCSLAGQHNGLSKVGRILGIWGRILNLVAICTYALFSVIAMLQ